MEVSALAVTVESAGSIFRPVESGFVFCAPALRETRRIRKAESLVKRKQVRFFINANFAK